MKITSKQIRQIIKEELEKVLNEMDRDSYFFNKRRKQMNDLEGEVSLGSESPSATPHPQRHKLYKMLRSGDPAAMKQAYELAKAVDDPLEIPVKGMHTIPFRGPLEKAAKAAYEYLNNTLPSHTRIVEVYDFYIEVKKRLSQDIKLNQTDLDIENAIYDWALDNSVAYEEYILLDR